MLEKVREELKHLTDTGKFPEAPHLAERVKLLDDIVTELMRRMNPEHF